MKSSFVVCMHVLLQQPWEVDLRLKPLYGLSEWGGNQGPLWLNITTFKPEWPQHILDLARDGLPTLFDELEMARVAHWTTIIETPTWAIDLGDLYRGVITLGGQRGTLDFLLGRSPAAGSVPPPDRPRYREIQAYLQSNYQSLTRSAALQKVDNLLQ